MLINLTPHTVHVIVDGERVTIPQGGRPVRVTCDVEHQAPVTHEGHELPLFTNAGTNVVGLPAKVDGTYYIVSRTVAHALRRKRDDLLVPHDLVLDENRRVRGCRALMRLT